MPRKAKRRKDDPDREKQEALAEREAQHELQALRQLAKRTDLGALSNRSLKSLLEIAQAQPQPESWLLTQAAGVQSHLDANKGFPELPLEDAALSGLSRQSGA